MDSKEPAYFDLETVALLREVLDDAWTLLRPEQRATMLKTTLVNVFSHRPLRANGTASDCSTPRSGSSRQKKLETHGPS
jgi:hypothetical protein